MSKKEFIDSIWPTIAQANSIAPEYGKVRRSRIILSQPNLGFFRAPKGTISRKPTESLYAEFIAGALMDGTTDEESEIGILEKHWMDEAKRFIGSIVHDIRPDATFKESDDLFITGAMDSLTVVELGQQLRLGLLRRMDKEKNTVNFWMRTIYENPTIDDLAKAILDAVFGQAESHTEPSQAVEVESVVEEFTSQLPEPKEQRPNAPLPTDGINVVLLGSRGRLGPFIVKDLLDNPRVAKIKCLDRGTFGEVSFQRRVDELGLDIDAKDLRLQFVSIDLSQPSLNLPQEQLDEIYKNVNVIIHSAWTVDSALSLPSFKPDMLKSVGAIIDMANTAQSRPRVVFMSSISTVQGWARTVSPNVAVPEEVIKCSTAVSPTGYAQSKHVAERLLATAATKLQIPVSILRLGQITGPTTMGDRGKWESHDLLHSVAKLSKASGIVPTDMGPIDWIPVDQMAHIIQELSLQEEHKDPDVEVYNLVHPRSIPFSKFTSALQRCIFSPRQFSFVDWVQHLENIKPNNLSKEAETEKIRSLPFFQALVDEMSSNITIEKSTIASPTMATMEPIDQELLEKWCQQWI
jgi:thioester reductase-like protein